VQRRKTLGGGEQATGSSPTKGKKEEILGERENVLKRGEKNDERVQDRRGWCRVVPRRLEEKSEGKKRFTPRGRVQTSQSEKAEDLVRTNG